MVKDEGLGSIPHTCIEFVYRRGILDRTSISHWYLVKDIYIYTYIILKTTRLYSYRRHFGDRRVNTSFFTPAVMRLHVFRRVYAPYPIKPSAINYNIIQYYMYHISFIIPRFNSPWLHFTYLYNIILYRYFESRILNLRSCAQWKCFWVMYLIV